MCWLFLSFSFFFSFRFIYLFIYFYYYYSSVSVQASSAWQTCSWRRRVSEDQKPLLEAIRSSSEGLLHVLSDILDLSKIENEKMALDFSDWNLRDHLFSCMSLFPLPRQGQGPAGTVLYYTVHPGPTHSSTVHFALL